MAVPYPFTVPEAFAINAAGANRNTIPDAPIGDQRASWSLGYPPKVMTPVVAGGKPMLGPDMNGVLYALSTHAVYAQGGKLYNYNADVVVAIGGYSIGTMLGSVDGSTIWYCTLAGNTNDPDVSMTGWVAMYAYSITTIPGLNGGGGFTLTPAQSAAPVIVLSGTLVANQQIWLPAQLRRWLIVNACTGAFVLTVKTQGGSGVSIPQGGFSAPVEVWCDGTNIYNVVAPITLPTSVAPTPDTIALRSNVGYLYATYFNQSSSLENQPMTAIFFEYNSDGFHRKISPLNLQAQLALANFSGQVSNAQVPQAAVTQHSAAILNNAALTGTSTAPTQGVGTNNATIATTAFVVAQALGNGQNWANVTGARAMNTPFTNTTGRAIEVSFQGGIVANGSCQATCQGVACGGYSLGAALFNHCMSFVVPPGAVYRIDRTAGGANAFTWSELT